MQAFHGDENIKTKYVNRVIAHQNADRLVKGATGKKGKGCAVACTLDMVYDHSRYPIELGIPEWLARVEDTLFEGMTLEKSQKWPEVFLEAIHVGSDLEKVKTPFIIKILERNLRSMDACVFDKKKNPDVTKAVEGSIKAVKLMIAAQKSGDAKKIEAAWSAAESAESAAWSARSAAWPARSAAWSARSAAWPARSAAWSARSAAWSARSAAESAESAAESAWSAAESAESAESAAFDEMADELIEIIRAVKN